MTQDNGKKPRVVVEDRLGAELPFSKGLMAASIMSTGLPPGPAYDLAEELEDSLLESGRSKITSDELSNLVEQGLARGSGPEAAARYRAWIKAKRRPQPIMVLIGGTTGVGKSTVATKLAARLAITRVIPTDAVRGVMRTLLTRAAAPEIHRSSFETDQDGLTEDPVEAFERQARRVVAGLGGLLDRLVIERKDVIVEGIHLIPGILQPADLMRYRSEATVVRVVLTQEDTEGHKSNFMRRLEAEHGRRPERYLEALDDIRRIQDHIRLAATRAGVPVIDAHDLDRAIQRVLDLVVAEVTGAGDDLAVEAG